MRTRPVLVSSAALFLATAALFSITVFVPLYLQTTTRRDADRGRTAARADDARHHAVDEPGRARDRPHRALQALSDHRAGADDGCTRLLAAVVRHPSQAVTGAVLAVFGFGFGMVGQVLIVAVQNSVDRRRLGIAMATTSFFRGLGGAVGAAVLGAVFAARVGTTAGGLTTLGATGRVRTSSTARRRCSWRPHRSPRSLC